METDYIRRDAATKIAEDGELYAECYHDRTAGYYYKKFKQDLLNISAADVQPVVRARWYWDAYKYDWCCGNCSHPADHYIDKDNVYKKPSFKFCPHCGANMLEVEMDDRIN